MITNDFYKAGRLIYNGADIQSIYDIINSNSLEDIKIKNLILDNLKIYKDVAYCVFKKDILKTYNISSKKLVDKISMIGFIKECPKWAFFIEEYDGKVKAELRCNRMYNVIGVAEKYNGGGHKRLSGAVLPSLEKVNDILQDLSNLESE